MILQTHTHRTGADRLESSFPVTYLTVNTTTLEDLGTGSVMHKVVLFKLL